VLAEVKGVSLEALAPILEANTNRIFAKLPRAAQEVA